MLEHRFVVEHRFGACGEPKRAISGRDRSYHVAPLIEDGSHMDIRYTPSAATGRGRREVVHDFRGGIELVDAAHPARPRYALLNVLSKRYGSAEQERKNKHAAHRNASTPAGRRRTRKFRPPRNSNSTPTQQQQQQKRQQQWRDRRVTVAGRCRHFSPFRRYRREWPGAAGSASAGRGNRSGRDRADIPDRFHASRKARQSSAPKFVLNSIPTRGDWRMPAQNHISLCTYL